MRAVIDKEKRITCFNEKVPGEYVYFYDKENDRYLVRNVSTGHHVYNSQNDPIDLPPEIKRFFVRFSLDYQPGLVSHPMVKTIAKVVGF